MQRATIGRMKQPELFGMEQQALAMPGGKEWLMTIKLISNDGASETVGMGTVHAQLMGTAGVRIESHERTLGMRPQQLVGSDGCLSATVVYSLARTIERVGK